MAEAILNTSTGEEEEEEPPKQEVKQQKVKRRGSVFSKLGSYRQKKSNSQQQTTTTRDSGKVSSSSSSHHFVLVSCSNSITCDVCGKPIANKPALQCQDCLVNVHENLCKDQTFPCVRCQHLVLCNGDSSKEKSCSLPEGGGGAGVVNLKATASVKEKRALSVPVRTSVQVASSTSAGPRSTSPGKAITEDHQKDATQRGEMGDDAINPNSLVVVDIQNFADTLSASVESLDDATAELADFDDEPDLVLTEHEPEAWSVTVDKKTLKKMTAKNIKRQDHIWELIQTEKSHYRTLKIMQRIFAVGMLRELNITQEMVDRIFPRLDDLIDIHVTFLLSLIGTQKLSADKSIEEIGDVLLQQFDGKMAERVKVAYGEFCSRHNEALQFYKDLLKSDSAFQAFIKKCSRNNLCKRLGIPECILLVTQRMTKYPLLIEPILKTTPENTRERKLLEQCLTLAREILSYIDRQVDAREKEQRLFDIYNKLDARSYAMLNGKKFKKSDLLSNKRKLLYEGSIKWMSARGKPYEVNAVILSDVVFFLAENSQKSTFFSQDNKSSVIPLSKLLVREKGDTRDSKGMYLICQSKTEPEMYEFICKSTEDRRHWIKTIRDAIINCPEEGEPSESEEERKLQEAIGARLRQLIDQLHQRDHTIAVQCQEKFNIALEILEIFAKDDLSSAMKVTEVDCDRAQVFNPETILQSILHEVTKLFALMQPVTRTVNVIRSFSSAGEHGSGPSTSVALPRRADTFSGFESRTRQKVHQKGDQEGANNSADEDTIVNDMAEEDYNKTVEDHVRDEGSEKTEVDQAMVGEVGRYGDASGDLSSDVVEAVCGQVQHQMELSLSKEQCFCIAKILQHVHEIVCISSRQMTEFESVRGQLSEANNKLLRLYSDNDRLSHERKSPNYHPDKQLEELRTLQESIQQQRSNLDRDRDEQSALMNIQRDELLQMQQDVDKQKVELKAQKEELQRQKEALQRQIDLFEEQKSRTMRAYSSVVAVAGHPQKSTDEVSRGQSIRNSSTPEGGGGNCKSLIDNICHQRSASDDLLQTYTWLQASDDARVKRGTNGHGSTRHSDGVSRHDDGRPVTRMHSMSAMSSGNLATSGVARRDKATLLPVQLLSATNEQRAGQVPQQLPLKLASPGSGDHSSAEINQSTAASSRGNRSSLKIAPVTQQQRLLAMPSQVHTPPGPVRSPPSADAPPHVATVQRTSSVTVARSVPPHLIPNSPQNVFSQNVFSHPAMSMSLVRTDLSPSRSAGHANPTSFIHSPPMSLADQFRPRLVSTQSAGNILPMKLAERQRPKSASASAQQSPVSQKRSSTVSRTPPGGCEESVHSTSSSNNKKEKQIIYF